MSILELKIPPVILTLLFAALMWLASKITSGFPLPPVLGLTAVFLFTIAGVYVGFTAVVSFRRAQTTVNPLHPDACSALVIEGVFKYTRNPMYLALLLMLIGWGIFLANALSLLLIIVFVIYLNRFQIVPEERALTAKFDQEFLEYKQQVRRWI